MISMVPGATSQSVYIKLIDNTTGQAYTGADAATAGLVISYQATPTGTVTAISLSDLAATNSAWSSGGMKHTGGGTYRLDVPNAAVPATEGAKTAIVGTATDYQVLGVEIVGRTVPASVANVAALNDLSEAEVAALIAALSPHAALTSGETAAITASVIAAITAAVDAGLVTPSSPAIVVSRAATWSQTIEGLPVLLGTDVIVVTVKRSKDHADAKALFQWRSDVGLEVWNGVAHDAAAPGFVVGDGAVAVTQLTPTGELLVTLTDPELTDMDEKRQLYYDVKRISAAGAPPVGPIRSGTWTIAPVVTHGWA